MKSKRNKIKWLGDELIIGNGWEHILVTKHPLKTYYQVFTKKRKKDYVCIGGSSYAPMLLPLIVATANALDIIDSSRKTLKKFTKEVLSNLGNWACYPPR